MLYSFFLFGTVGCIFEINLTSPPYHKNLEQTEKMLRGFIFGLDRFCQRVFPQEPEVTGQSFELMETDSYRLHYYESLTGYKLVCISDKQTPLLINSLKDIYEKIFVPVVVLHPQFRPLPSTGEKSRMREELERMRALVMCTTFPADVGHFFKITFRSNY